MAPVTVLLIFIMALIFLERSHRCLLSLRNSSLWSLVMGNASANPTTSKSLTWISNPPGALSSAFTSPFTITEDSTRAFLASANWESSTAPLMTVTWMIPVWSRIWGNAILPLLRVRKIHPLISTSLSVNSPFRIFSIGVQLSILLLSFLLLGWKCIILHIFILVT